MSERITKYATNGGGGANLGVKLLGIEVLVSPKSADEQAVAERIAQMIAALGQEASPVVVVAPVQPSAPRSLPVRPAKASFVVGERVWCNVHGAESFTTITEVGTGRNGGRVKVNLCRGWCPAFNFDHRAE